MGMYNCGNTGGGITLMPYDPKEEVQMKHMANRQKLLREGVVSQTDYDAAVKLMESKK